MDEQRRRENDILYVAAAQALAENLVSAQDARLVVCRALAGAVVRHGSLNLSEETIRDATRLESTDLTVYLGYATLCAFMHAHDLVEAVIPECVCAALTWQQPAQKERSEDETARAFQCEFDRIHERLRSHWPLNAMFAYQARLNAAYQQLTVAVANCPWRVIAYSMFLSRAKIGDVETCNAIDAVEKAEFALHYLQRTDWRDAPLSVLRAFTRNIDQKIGPPLYEAVVQLVAHFPNGTGLAELLTQYDTPSKMCRQLMRVFLLVAEERQRQLAALK